MHQSIPIFFFNDTATTEIYTLSLHDALPISAADQARQREPEDRHDREQRVAQRVLADHHALGETLGPRGLDRSEEHTSELQSQSNIVCRLLLEKKKQANTIH